jgi:hypothetical protein
LVKVVSGKQETTMTTAAKISQLVGTEVEITVRGDTSFTFSTETVTANLGTDLAQFFGSLATVTVEHDDECGSFAYVELAR